MRPVVPAVSVVMPVHNAGTYLDQCIQSIVDQTFRDFEFIIVDDCSTDGSTAALREWARRDCRIRLFESTQTLGPSGSSNYVVRHARAPLVARMDADDVSHPERLARQRRVLAAREDVVLVGTLCDGIDAQGRGVRPRDRWRLMRASLYPPFPHGSVMFRRAAFESVGGYQAACAYWEDQDLFLRLTRSGRIVVLPDLLYRYRYHATNMTGSAPLDRGARACGIRRLCLEEFRAGRDYAGLLVPNGESTVSPNGTAEALYQTATMRLWAGHPPAILREALTRGMRISPRAALTLVLAAWGSVSPSTLRSALREFIRARDILAGLRIKDGRAYEWRLR